MLLPPFVALRGRCCCAGDGASRSSSEDEDARSITASASAVGDAAAAGPFSTCGLRSGIAPLFRCIDDTPRLLREPLDLAEVTEDDPPLPSFS